MQSPSVVVYVCYRTYLSHLSNYRRRYCNAENVFTNTYKSYRILDSLVTISSSLGT